MAPDAVTELSAKLRQAYSDAWARVKAQEAAIASDPARYAKAARLRNVERRIVAEMDRLDDQARAFLTGNMPDIYQAGADVMAAQLGVRFDFGQIHREAVATLAGDTFADLLTATQGVRASAKTLIRFLSRETSLAKMIEAKTSAEAGRELRRELQDRGIHSIVYVDGSKHGVAEYSNMVIRTKTGVAYNAGGINLAAEHGVEYLEVFDGPECGWIGHDDADHANGTVRPIDECASVALSHPNCQRAFGPRPDIKSKAELKAANDAARLFADPIEKVSLEHAAQRRAQVDATRAARTASHRQTASKALTARAQRSGGQARARAVLSRRSAARRS